MEALRQLRSSMRKAGTIERSTTETALLMQAVIFYERATAGNGGRGQRGSLQLRSKLTDALKEDHDTIVHLQNKGIAHVYHGEEIGERIWSEQAILFVEVRQKGFVPCVATRSSQFSQRIFDALAVLLPFASEVARNKAIRSLEAITKAFQSVSFEALMKHAIDPIPYFGTTDKALSVAATAHLGEATII
jgi:hypothetical protein